MGPKNPDKEQDLELEAMAKLYAALKPLDAEAQTRVLDYVIKRLSLKVDLPSQLETSQNRKAAPEMLADEPIERHSAEEPKRAALGTREGVDGLEGISLVAQKWMKRNGFTESQLSRFFTLGVDEIDLVAKSIPGKTKADKFANVLRLQGIASYLGNGVARTDWNKLKQALGHYGADPGTNFWNYMKRLASEVTGSTSSGFALTSRGLNSATELLKEMTGADKADK